MAQEQPTERLGSPRSGDVRCSPGGEDGTIHGSGPGPGDRPDLAAVCAAAVAFSLPLAVVPVFASGPWSARYAVVIALAFGGGALSLTQLSGRDRRTSLVVASWGVIAVLSALTSRHPLLSIAGEWEWGTGAIFVWGLIGALAVGRITRPSFRPLVAKVVLAALAVDAVVALVQTRVDLSAYQLGLAAGERADGLAGNPVYLGGLLAGGIWYLARCAALPSPLVCLLLVLFGAGLQVSGSRVGLLVSLAGVLVSLPNVRRTALVAVALSLGLVVGGMLMSGSTATTRLSSDSSGLTARQEAWRAGVQAGLSRPVLGHGPGRFLAATSELRTLRFARAEGANRYYLDAHNFLVESFVTTGTLGLLALLTLLVTVFAKGRGDPFHALAMGVLLVSLAEPWTVATTPVAFLALGLGLPRPARPPGRPRRPPMLVPFASAIGVGTAGAFLIGSFALRQAQLDFEPHWARQARTLLPLWPQPIEAEARIAVLRNIETGDPRFEIEAITLRMQATELDPEDPRLLYSYLATLFVRGQGREALTSLPRLLELDPWSTNGLNLAGEIYASVGDIRQARLAFERSLLVDPEQEAVRRYLMETVRRSDEDDMRGAG